MASRGEIRGGRRWLLLLGFIGWLGACGANPESTPEDVISLPPQPRVTSSLAQVSPTPSPIVKATPTLTPTPTFTPTSIPTPTPTSTPTPLFDVDKIPLLDQAAQEVPVDWVWFESSQGFRIAHPPDWIAIDLTEDDWAQLLQAVEDAIIRERMTEQVKALIASQTAALITAPVPEPGGEAFPFVSNVNIIFSNVPPALSQDQVVEGVLQNLQQIPGLRVEMLNRGQIQGHPAVAALYTYPGKGLDDKMYTVVGWQVYIRTRQNRMGVLTFTTLADVFSERIQDFARMAASFDTTE